MKAAAIVLCALLVAGVVVRVLAPTRHLTTTLPEKVKLAHGTNIMEFPVVQGRYLLRLGGADMEPAAFRFRIRGDIETPGGRMAMDESYTPQPEVQSRQEPGGYISRRLEVTNRTGLVRIEIEASFPEGENLTCTFQGIK